MPERTTGSKTGLLAVLFIGFILSGIATTIVGPIVADLHSQVEP